MQLSRHLFAAALIATIGVTAFGLSRQQAKAVSVSSGDLIRGQAFSAVYYVGDDGFRYVFGNQKVYDTWYSNFDNIKFITDAELAKIQIGGNVTYKPGTRMVKINSDPKTYAVAPGGVLQHVGSEAIAVSMYGNNWSTKIDDIPDGFFSNYVIGEPITTPRGTVEPVAGYTINLDKGLKAPKTISVTDAAYSPIDVTVTPGQGVKFTNNGSTKHTATADDLSWGTGTLNPGDSFIRSFKTPGTYTFFDSYDSSNTGAIYVQ